MTVRFYDVGQGLASLVELADGRRVLVDTGDDPARSSQQCHGACAGWHSRLMADLERDLGGHPIDLLWITHQHSDHLGGAADVMARFSVGQLVDNGQEPGKREVRHMHDVAASRGTRVTSIGPGNEAAALTSSPSARLTAIVPERWPHACARDANDCSIGLRIDQCASSVLFVGDAQRSEEDGLDPRGHVTLLQVGHHGSDTSTSPAFLARVAPKYAVISAGKRGEGTNAGYCHPRRSVVERLTAELGDAPTGTVASFDATGGCGKEGEESHWIDARTSARLWITARDGDVVLSSVGDGVFLRR